MINSMNHTQIELFVNKNGENIIIVIILFICIIVYVKLRCH